MEKNIRTEFNNVIRNEFIENHPTCQYCGSPAKHVHHLIPIAAGGDNRESNLIPQEEELKEKEQKLNNTEIQLQKKRRRIIG